MKDSKSQTKNLVTKAFVIVLVFILAALPLTTMAAETEASPNITQAQQRRIIGYFFDWAPMSIDRIPWGKVTHIHYAYAGVGTDNRIKLNDVAAAIQQVFPGQDTSLPYRGHFNLLNTYKQQYPETKTLISIGEWEPYGNFNSVTAQQASMDTFADSVVAFLRQYDFDGVDMDFRYPGYDNYTNLGTAAGFRVFESHYSHYDKFLQLLQTLREKLDGAGEEDGKHYILTMVAPASARILSNMGHGEYAQYLDYLSIATFDMSFPSNYAGPNSALYADSRDPEEAGLALPTQSIDWAYKYFRGVLPAEKLNIGVAYHTRGWKNVTPGAYPGGLYGSLLPIDSGADGANGIWNSPSFPTGTNPLYYMKNLLADPLLDYDLFWDNVTKTSYAWNGTENVFLTFEDENSMQEKVQYIIDNGIGGLMAWELSTDFDYDDVNNTFVPGDTLTTLVHNMFEAAPPLVPEPDSDFVPDSGLVSNFDYSLTTYNIYPFTDYALIIDNNTGVRIPEGFTLEFDFPSSAVLQPPWMAETISQQDNGIFTHYVWKMRDYMAIENGARFVVNGLANLCFTGEFRNLQINGRYSAAKYKIPMLSGIVDIQIFNGTPFDAMNGVSAYDVDDGDLTNAIMVSGTVDTNTPGSYLLTYNVTNSSNKTVTVTRTVTVLPGPEIYGVGNIQHLIDTAFDPLAGVTAHDKIDGDLTAHIVVTGSVNSAVVGTYHLTYAVTNSNNLTNTVTRTVTVIYSPWDPDQFYLNGACVSYQGNNYRAKWWTQNEVPGSYIFGAWELI